MKYIITISLTAILLTLCHFVKAQEIIEITPLTNRMLMIHLDEGDVNYKTSTINKEALDIDLSDLTTTYGISSIEDANYSTFVAPLEVGRKTKATDYGGTQSGLVWQGNHFDPTSERWASEHWIYLELPTALVSGTDYTLNTSDLLSSGSNWTFTFDEMSSRSEAVHTNTIGYNVSAPKFGYLYHWAGTFDSLDFSAYAGNKFWVILENTQTVVKEGTINFRSWASNEETTQSGETPDKNFLGSQVYDADFSDVTTPGNYVLAIEGIGTSYPFKIGDDPIWEAYYATMRGLYLARNGIRIEAMANGAPYVRPVNQNPMITGVGGISFKDKLVYSTLPYGTWTQENGQGAERDAIIAASVGNTIEVTGWYHDAGDWDMYHTHNKIPMMLMTLYEHFPERFGDDEYDIPESGNGLPDIVDEASWLVKFNYRLRKELMTKGYSDGGVGGARVAPDPFSGIDGDPEEEGEPSWHESRRTMVTAAEPYTTFQYAGQAAHFAVLLKKLGRNPLKYAVENLDALEFADMSYDTVDWINEAEEAFEWAMNPSNDAPKSDEYASNDAYKVYAAVNLYRATSKRKYHTIAKAGLKTLKSSSWFGEDLRFGPYSYLLADNFDVDLDLQNSLLSATERTADFTGLEAAGKRATRWGGIFSFPLLIGHATTPMMFDVMIAYAVTNDNKYKDVVHNTADYFLGTNPLHSTNMTGVGPRPVQEGFHLDSRVISDNWEVYPGYVPYGPFRKGSTGNAFNSLRTYTMPDGLEREGGVGPWNTQWFAFSLLPAAVEDWPGHERFAYNVHSPQTAENTIHQNQVHAAMSYGFVNGRTFTNGASAMPVASIALDSGDFSFEFRFQTASVTASVDNLKATTPILKFSSSNPAVAHVSENGIITAVDNGSAIITCSTLDGSVSTSITITNTNLMDAVVTEVNFEEDKVSIRLGSTITLNPEIIPEAAVNRALTWSTSNESVLTVDEGQVTAIATGSAWVKAVSDENPEAKDSVLVEVLATSFLEYINFDDLIPFVGGKRPDQVEFFSPGNTIDINADNPEISPANTSAKVVKVDKSAGTYKLVGFSAPLNEPVTMCAYSQLEFSYYSEKISQFQFQVKLIGEEAISSSLDVQTRTGWNTVAIDLPAQGFLEEVLIFFNPLDETQFTAYFDNFRFAETPGGEACVGSTVLLDFENIQLNFSNGYGAFSFNSSEHGIIDNPMKNSFNSSDKIFRWVNDGTSFGGGYGIIFPITSLQGSTTASFKVYSETALDRIDITLQKGVDPNIESSYIALENLSLPANEWTTVTWDLAAMGNPSLDSMQQILVQPGVGTQAANTFWMDDFLLSGKKVSSIELSADTTELYPSDSVAIYANPLPFDASNRNVTWQSDHAEIATISEEGIVTGKSAGTVTITATSVESPNVTADIVLTVKSITITIIGDESVTLAIGETYQGEAEIDPATITNPGLLWETDDASVASVSEMGLIEGLSVGETFVEAYAEAEESSRATIKVSVVSVLSSKKAQNKVSLYPNPVNGNLNIISNEIIDVIDIYEMTGKLVFTKSFLSTKADYIDLSKFQAGLYRIKIQSAGGNVSTKLIMIEN